jgi:ribosomal protein L11 methyltransferase
VNLLSLLRVSVVTTPDAEDAVAELLGASLGQPASIYHDIETLESTVSVYLPQASAWSPAVRAQVRDGLLRITTCGLTLGSGKIKARTINRKDWAESWKRHFKPFVVGSALLVKPSWSRRRPLRTQAVVVLDPGLSFGTGQHPTTRFCLEQLVGARKRCSVQSFLDIGTGSGILAIAAARLNYRPIEAFDFDPDSVRIARANARQNRVGGWLKISRRDLTRLPVSGSRRYGVVCANLIHDLLVEERRRILNRVRPGGLLVLAGILRSQLPAVLSAYEAAGCIVLARRAVNEWESVAFECP